LKVTTPLTVMLWYKPRVLPLLHTGDTVGPEPLAGIWVSSEDPANSEISRPVPAVHFTPRLDPRFTETACLISRPFSPLD
ncbi:MAG: hypothetical protein VYC04_01335, partial [Actinomycetota bacterium]|nr:hypothetical protein [Actinomycetota bacterium]